MSCGSRAELLDLLHDLRSSCEHWPGHPPRRLRLLVVTILRWSWPLENKSEVLAPFFLLYLGNDRPYPFRLFLSALVAVLNCPWILR
jgi:hypothetical protein